MLVPEKPSGVFPLRRLIPNIMTIASICLGLTAIRCGLEEKWELALWMIIVAALIDGLDGRLARLLKVDSDFGVQLDSLADFVNFGVAPALLVYFWQLHTLPIKRLAWAITLLYVICSMLRLARFNVASHDTPLKWHRFFFKGVPMPIAGMMALIPLMLYFQFEWEWCMQPSLLAGYIMAIALLMVSRIPTFSAKHIAVTRRWVMPLMLCVGAAILGIIIEPWFTIPLLGLIYIAVLPVSMYVYRQLERRKTQ